MTTTADPFDHPCWDWVRSRIAGKVTEIRAQGFSGAAILSYFELECGGIVVKMNKLGKKFTVKNKNPPTNAKKLLTTYYLLFFPGLDLISQHYAGDSVFHE